MSAVWAFELPPQPKLIVPFAYRWYQTEAVQSIYDFFEALPSGAEGNPIVALPTGTGKSIVIALFILRVLSEWSNTRILCLTHVKELIEQNAGKLDQIAPNIPYGICSAGLKQKDSAHAVIFGGVQTVVKMLEAFGWRDLIVIDECHLLSPDEASSYSVIIAFFKKINPKIRVIGLSATPFRIGQGMLTEDVEKEDKKTIKLFTHVCYDMTDMEGWKRLIAEGFLCPPITPSRINENGAQQELIELSTKGVGMVKGDYNAAQLEKAVDKDPLTRAALTQAVQLGANRYSWLAFAAGIHHAERIWRMLNDEFGIPTCVIHSKRTAAQNAEALEAWKRGDARCAVNMNSLTTGVDHKPTDFIIMLRPTMSAGLWVQMLGRGTRPYDFNTEPDPVLAGNFPFTKLNCLVADFARNTKTLGPINDPRIPKKKGKGSGDVPVKICPACGTYNHTRAAFCELAECSYEFPHEVDIAKTASTEDIIKSEIPVTEYFDVSYVIYNLHEKRDKKTGELLSPPMMRADYICGMQRFSEYLCFEHKGFPKHRAHEWWKQRTALPVPLSTAEALKGATTFRQPTRIRVWVNKQPQEVLNPEWGIV